MPESSKLPFTFAMNINTQDGADDADRLQQQHDQNFCIALLGNFSATAEEAHTTALAERHFIQIDRYNIDEVLASMKLQLALDQPDGSNINVTINAMKDFHPDQLYKNLPVFDQLRDLRKRLLNPETFQQALQELGIDETREEELPLEPASAPAQTTSPQTVKDSIPPASGGSLLDSILAETEDRGNQGIEPAQSAAEPTSKLLVNTLIRQLVSKHSKTVKQDPRRDEMVAFVDAAITQQMRSLLHHPRFQAVESCWRGVHFMVKRIPANRKVKLYLLDLSRAELAADLANDDVTQSPLYQQFCDTSQGDIRWNLIIGDYRFGPDIDDILQLSQIGIIAQQAGAQFIAAADEKLVGCPSFAEAPKTEQWSTPLSESLQQAWTLMRKSPVAKNISLALPRFLLRAPYGCKDAALKTFAFEELSEQPAHRDYLWGNPAFLKAEQIARAFIDSGWDMHYANVMTTEDLPVHYVQKAGQTLVTPCAEIPLNECGAAKMLAQGLIPLWSIKNSDRVNSGDFHSIAE